MEFDNKNNANAMYNQRFYLASGIFVDREFNFETEKCRRTLRLILRAAKQKPEFCYRSSMDRSKLVIDGKRYSVNELDRLPQKLSPFEVTTKSNDDTVGFLESFVRLVISILWHLPIMGKDITVLSNLSNIRRPYIVMILELQTVSWPPKVQLPANSYRTLSKTMINKVG